MSQITIRQTGGLGENENTLCEYDNEVSFDLLNHRLKIISDAMSHDNGKEYACYLVGMGGLPKSAYLDIQKKFDADVVWVDSLLPKYIKILSCIVASYAGLVKINDPKELPDIFSLMIDQSMAGIYFFPKEYESEFVSLVKKNPLPESSDFGIKEFKDYFFYMVDADNAESSTGIYEVVSYGVCASFISNHL